MATLQTLNLLLSSSSSSRSCRGSSRASLHAPINLGKSSSSLPKFTTMARMEELLITEEKTVTNNTRQRRTVTSTVDEKDLTEKLYAVMEAAADRAEMHDIIGVQRGDWNTLLLNSINSITLAASMAAGLSAIPIGDGSAPHHLAFKVSSAVLYSAATAMLLAVNKIQPSQLAEEQRNAARLFRQLEKKIQTTIAIGNPTPTDVEDAMERVLALDKAYPLSLLPGMLEKFPETVEPTVWWPKLRHRRVQQRQRTTTCVEANGWSRGLEDVMTGVLRVVKKKDTAEYLKLGRLVLKINKILAVSGPLLTGLAAVGAGLIDSSTGHGPWPVLLGVAGGALATVVNTLEHGGQVGMVFELYRNCAGFYRQMEEEIELNLEEEEVDKRENGELFEIKTALRLGRSLSELRSLSSSSCCADEEDHVEEYAGKLF